MWAAEVKANPQPSPSGRGQGEGQQAPLVFIHGAAGSHRLFANQMQAFRDLTTCYFLDLPGHGNTPQLRRPPSIALYASSVIDFLTDLASPAILLGHSMGGAIALHTALSRPDLVGKLILAGTGCQLPVSERLLHRPRNRLRRLARHHSPLLLLQIRRSRSLLPRAHRIRKTDPAIVRADFHACNAFDICNRLHEILLPTLIICGDADRMTPLAYSQHLQASIANARLEVIPGGSHMLMLEQPDLFNAILKRMCECAYAPVR